MDKRAKKILFETYWKNGCWTRPLGGKRHTDEADFLYAKEKGLMFDPLSISHDDCVSKIVELASEIPQDKLAKAFLSSLSTRRLELRSAIASWFIAKQLPPHRYMPVAYSDDKELCGVCKEFSLKGVGEAQYIVEQEHYENEDLNVLNFERIKWGGVRYGELLYTLFDLEQFQKEYITEPTDDDIAIFHDILKVIESSSPNDYPGKLRDRLSDVSGLKSNKDERTKLLEILACIGILKPASLDRPTNIRNEWRFVEFWRGKDKYDKEVVRNIFGEYI